MRRGRGDISLVTAALLGALVVACGANEDILKSGKASPSPANVQGPQTTVDDAVASMRTADFRYIWVIRRKDGGVLDTADKAIIRPNTLDMNRRVVTDDQKAVVLGSNTLPFRDNFDALVKAFDIEDFSPEPVPSPLPTRVPTPKASKRSQ